MKLLLDTHILLAVLDEGAKSLSGPMLEAVSGGDVVVSTASLWEISIKVRTRKLALGVPIESLAALCEEAIGIILPIKPQHVLLQVEPVPETRDPFDRLLLAQAAYEKLLLVTLDTKLVDHPRAWRPTRS